MGLYLLDLMNGRFEVQFHKSRLLWEWVGTYHAATLFGAAKSLINHGTVPPALIFGLF
jgi:hypothetical protein